MPVIHYGQCAENIPDDIDCVVYTAAIIKLTRAYGSCCPQEDSNAYTCRASWTADEKLQDTDRCIRYSRKNYYYFHDLSYFLAADLDPTISVGGISRQSVVISALENPRLLSQKPANIQTVSFIFIRRSVSSSILRKIIWTSSRILKTSDILSISLQHFFLLMEL